MRATHVTMIAVFTLCAPAVALAVPPTGGAAPAVDAHVRAPEVPKVAANTTDETHRVNGPQIVYGATKAESGKLTMVELQPGTKGWDFRTR